MAEAKEWMCHVETILLERLFACTDGSIHAVCVDETRLVTYRNVPKQLGLNARLQSGARGTRGERRPQKTFPHPSFPYRQAFSGRPLPGTAHGIVYLWSNVRLFKVAGTQRGGLGTTAC